MGKDKKPKLSGAKKAQSSASSSASHSHNPIAPDWPPFRPPLPVTDLSFAYPWPGFEDTIAVIRNFWPKSLCREYVNFLRTLPLTTTPGRPKRGEAVRQNDRFQIDDPAFSRKLWLETGLKDVVLENSVKSLWYVHKVFVSIASPSSYYL